MERNRKVVLGVSLRRGPHASASLRLSVPRFLLIMCYSEEKRAAARLSEADEGKRATDEGKRATDEGKRAIRLSEAHEGKTGGGAPRSVPLPMLTQTADRFSFE
jgi:hypothetical protein